MINAYRCVGQRSDFVASDERAANDLYRPKFGHRFAIASHDERLASGYRVDHLGIVIPKIALGDCPCHLPTVAQYATVCYVIL